MASTVAAAILLILTLGNTEAEMMPGWLVTSSWRAAGGIAGSSVDVDREALDRAVGAAVQRSAGLALDRHHAAVDGDVRGLEREALHGRDRHVAEDVERDRGLGRRREGAGGQLNLLDAHR